MHRALPGVVRRGRLYPTRTTQQARGLEAVLGQLFKHVSLSLGLLTVACSSQLVPDAPGRLGGSSVSGQAFGLESAAAIEGADVCVLDREDLCTSTDADGRFELTMLPDQAELLISIDAEGRVRALRLLRTGDANATDLGYTTIPTLDTLAMQRETLQIGTVERTGLVAFYLIARDLLPVLQVRARLSPVEGDGPFYFNSDGTIDPVAMSGVDASGYFYNVPVGDFALGVTTPGADTAIVCDEELPGLGWGLDPDGQGHRVRVVADAMTFVVPQCPFDSATVMP